MGIEELKTIIYLSGSVLIFLIGQYVFFKDPKRNLNKIFFILSISAAIWGVSTGLLRLFYPEYYTLRIEELIKRKDIIKIAILSLFSASGGFFLASIFLHLSLILTEREERKKVFFIYLPFLFFLLYDNLLYLTLFILMKGNLPKIYAKSDQILSIFFLILFDIYLYIAFYFLFKKFLSLKSYQEKIKFGYFLIGASIPAFPGSVLLILGVARILPGQGWLIFPLFVLGYFFVGIGILKHGLFIDYREILEKIFRGLTELVIVTDREGWILLTNEMTLSKFGYSMEEVSEKKVEDILKGGREKWNEMLRKLGKLKTIFEERTSFFTKYGKEIPFLLSLSQIKEGIIFVGRDIRELLEYQKKLEEEVKKRTEELEEAKTVLEIKVAARTRELKELAERREEIVKERTKELREKLEELERFHKIAVSKELRMVELKKEIERLKKELEKSQKNKSKIKKEKEDCNAHR